MPFRLSLKLRNNAAPALAAILGLVASSAGLNADDAPPAPPPPQTQPAATQPSAPAAPAPAPSDSQPAKGDLRELIGVNPNGLKRVETPRLPSMTLRGYIEPKGQSPLALLEITELNRVFLVRVGTEIPITIQGHLSPVGGSELTGLGDQGRSAPVPNDAGEQSQIILKVMKITNEGVTVEAGLLAQTIIIK